MFQQNLLLRKNSGHNARRKLYSINYDDGDSEESTRNQVKCFLKPLHLDSMSRQEQVEKEYWTAHQSDCQHSPWISPLIFSKGYAMTTKLLSSKSSWFDDSDFFSNTYSEYNEDDVIDEETGKHLEYWHLIDHPNFTVSFRAANLKTANNALKTQTPYSGSTKAKFLPTGLPHTIASLPPVQTRREK